MAQLIEDKRILWPKRQTGRPRLKRYLSDMLSETTGYSTVLDAPGNVEATKELSRILGPKAFAFPKPTELIKRIVQQATDVDDLILDSFAGSGTTGHAVLAVNHEDHGNRRFILCEMDSNIARDITAERLKRVITGYADTPGLGSSFRYCTLGEPLFDSEGRLREDVKWSDLAHHLWFAESGEPWTTANIHSPTHQSLVTGGPLIGVAPDGRAIYLLYSNLLSGAERNGVSTLSSETIDSLAPYPGSRVVYADACTLRASALSREQIVFKQIPYQIPQQ
jgi:site-specific DNA-methyltransferase (adenine-specific)/adenine-specific DNA-methyltransferase